MKKQWRKVSIDDLKIFFKCICLALIAYKLNKALAHEADDDELEVEVATELGSYAELVLNELLSFQFFPFLLFLVNSVS